MVHIGSKIKEVFNRSGMTKKAFAEKINKGRENTYDIFKRESIDTELLLSIGKVLNHNFFNYFISDDEKKETIEKVETTQKVRIAFELDISKDDLLKLGLKDRVLEVLK